MLAVERYLTLYRRFAGDLGAGAATEASLEQVAEVLYCSERNAKLILRKLTEKGYIEWKAGRGRGNRSQITFREDQEKLLLDLSRQYAEDGEYNKAFQLLQTFGEGTASSEKFMEWMNGTFGFRKQLGKHTDVLRLPITKPLVTLDPAEVIFSFDAHLMQQIWDRLVVLDEDTGRILPGIAHDWEHNEDATMWTFHLRKSVLFHDGIELTADDVVSTIERLRRGKLNSWIVRTLSRVEAVSERMVRFHLAKPNWLFIKFACSILMAILPSGLRGLTEEAFWKHPIGTGPFRVKERAEGKLLLEANEAYYQTRPLLDQVEIVQVPQHEEIKADAARWKQLIGTPNQPDISAENGWVKLESNNVCTSMLSWNMQRDGLHQSEHFRRIVDQLVDRKRMISELGGYRYSPANGFFPSSDRSSDRLASSSDEELRQQIAQFGFNQSPVTLCALPGHQEDVLWLQQRCMEYGIQLQIRIESADRLYHIQSEIDAVYHALVFPDGEVSLIESLEQEDSFLNCMVSPQIVVWIRDKIDEALACEDITDRNAIYAEIKTRLRGERQIIFMLHTRFNTDYHPSLNGVRINSLGWIDFKHIWRA